jgi:hypothetical protein
MATDALKAPRTTLPTHFIDLKREIAASTLDFTAKITTAWSEVIEELAAYTDRISKTGTDVSVDRYLLFALFS